MATEPGILLFDGLCNLCNGMVQFIIKRDPAARFRFAALQSEAGKSMLKKNGLPTDYIGSLIYIKGNNYYRKSTAALNILKDLGGAWRLAYSLMIFPPFIRNFFYDIISKTRYSIFGKRDSCMIPTQELRSRFLG